MNSGGIMNDHISFIESLTENVEDWFYSNHKRACYDAVDDYIDDIRCMIANNNDNMVNTCMCDLVSVYCMNKSEVNSHVDDITDLLVKEAQNALENFSYDRVDDDEDY